MGGRVVVAQEFGEPSVGCKPGGHRLLGALESDQCRTGATAAPHGKPVGGCRDGVGPACRGPAVPGLLVPHRCRAHPWRIRAGPPEQAGFSATCTQGLRVGPAGGTASRRMGRTSCWKGPPTSRDTVWQKEDRKQGLRGGGNPIYDFLLSPDREARRWPTTRLPGANHRPDRKQAPMRRQRSDVIGLMHAMETDEPLSGGKGADLTQHSSFVVSTSVSSPLL